ncbi:uncharacterized protein PSFLO_07266 [Pseudozyma flocculosa]|uniref:Nucleoporin Nup54 alpha-helical domain-containing protein n=2 Tax=Pseudozyma flocculosa TaxID=84751 RepID=A0A5C3FBF3_9BASI|nr:uncharacterized protein PSFLO_07266 [Pseudozyma flocculosa]
MTRSDPTRQRSTGLFSLAILLLLVLSIQVPSTSAQGLFSSSESIFKKVTTPLEGVVEQRMSDYSHFAAAPPTIEALRAREPRFAESLPQTRLAIIDKIWYPGRFEASGQLTIAHQNVFGIRRELDEVNAALKSRIEYRRFTYYRDVLDEAEGRVGNIRQVVSNLRDLAGRVPRGENRIRARGAINQAADELAEVATALERQIWQRINMIEYARVAAEGRGEDVLKLSHLTKDQVSQLKRMARQGDRWRGPDSP